MTREALLVAVSVRVLFACAPVTEATEGAWTVTLTSVAPYTGTDNNGPHYIVHGTVTGTLPSADAGSVNLSATF